jgi:hypothetical protein
MWNKPGAHLMKKRNPNNSLKNKTRSYSAQAAVTTVAIHLLLIIFAGSIVAVRYVQKQNAQLVARTESRPKLERKKLQASAKVEQLQKRALVSKLVSKKVSFANPEFVLPDTGKISSLKTQKFSLPGTDAGRALRNLSRSSGIGPASINFFGVRAEGEKIVFVIDASSAMLGDQTGGSATYEYIKNELSKIVSEMNPALLFNLIFYDQQRVYMFRSGLIPAARGAAVELTEWMRAVNDGPEPVGLISNQNNYQSPVLYETALGSDAQGWLLALQAALEQQPDTIMILGSGWGRHNISPEKATLLREYAMWELLVGNIISGAQVLGSDRKLRNDLLKTASTAIQKEEKLRKAKTLPIGFVRDIAQYVEYPRDQVLDHLEVVGRTAYSARGLSRPDIHYVCLTEADDLAVAGGSLQYLRALTTRNNGKLGFLRREAVQAGIAKNGSSQITPESGAESGLSPVKFFGIQGKGARIAFVLDASKNILSDETGGAFCYSFIKEQIQKGVEGIQPGAQFNVIVYNDRQLALFQPQMVPASPENMAALEGWLRPVNSDLTHAGIPDGIGTGVAAKDYGTVIGSDAADWLLALQTAIEQKADVVFIAGSGWGNQSISRAKGHKLLDFSVWEKWGSGGTAGGDETEETGEDGEEVADSTAASSVAGGGSSLGTITGLQQDKKQRDALLKEALKTIKQEDMIRKSKGLPQPFIRDILSYLRYTVPQVSEHLNAVVQAHSSNGEAGPVVNYICLTPEENTNTVMIRNLQKLTSDYEGSFILFRGADNREEIKKLNRDIELTD